MKRIIFFIVLLVACLGFATESMASPKKVAVYTTGQVSSPDKSIINSAVIGRLSESKDYTAFERNEAFMDALNSEQDYQVSGEVPEKEIRKVGERLGVDYVIVVNTEISDDNKCHMTARLIELSSGKIIKSVNLKRKFTDSDVISNMANNIAYRLLNLKSK